MTQDRKLKGGNGLLLGHWPTNIAMGNISGFLRLVKISLNIIQLLVHCWCSVAGVRLIRTNCTTLKQITEEGKLIRRVVRLIVL